MELDKFNSYLKYIQPFSTLEATKIKETSGVSKVEH